MIDIEKAKLEFKKFLEKYKNINDQSFNMKVIHTYQVSNNSRNIAEKLDLEKEDIELAELIGLLHDIGRFEELKITKGFNSNKFNHAIYGAKILFDDGLIRNFIEDYKYDSIIRVAIENHNKLTIDENLDERTMLHCKIIRDADKVDNFRVKEQEKIETSFPNIPNIREEIETGNISDLVFDAVKKLKCVNILDRKTGLDYWICVLAFIFDLNYSVSYQYIKEHNYINILIDKFDYKNLETKKKMEEIRNIINNYIEKQIVKNNRGE